MREEAGSLQRVSILYDLTVVLFSFFWNVQEAVDWQFRIIIHEEVLE